MKLCKQIIFLLLMLLPAVSFALSSDNKQPANLSANQADYDRITHTTVYSGNITYQQGTTTLNADKLLVYDNQDNHKIYKIVALGDRAHYSTIPDGKNYRLHARAKIIKYYPEKGLAELIGKGELTQLQDTFKGPHITYNLAKQTLTSTPSKNNFTTIVLQP